MATWLSEATQIHAAIRKLIAEAGQLSLAVAFWGRDAHSRLGLKHFAGSSPVRVLCNLTSGGTNPVAIRELLNKGIEVRHHADLHAKVYCSERQLIVGSANVSANGLSMQGLEVEGWIEVCLATADRTLLTDGQAWFERVWRTSLPVYEADLQDAERRWSARRRAVSIRSAETPLSAPRDLSLDELEGRRIYVVVTSEYMSPGAIKNVEKKKSELGTDIDGYQTWSSMPLNATLMDFALHVSNNAASSAEFDGFWLSPTDARQKREYTVGAGRNQAVIVRRERKEPFPMNVKNRRKWEHEIVELSNWMSQGMTPASNRRWNDWCLPLETVRSMRTAQLAGTSARIFFAKPKAGQADSLNGRSVEP